MILKPFKLIIIFFILYLSPGCSPKSSVVQVDQTPSPPEKVNVARIWKDADTTVTNFSCPAFPLPLEYRLLDFDTAASRKLLIFQGEHPGEVSADIIMVEIPMPDGSWELFQVNQVQVMAPALAAKYPYIKTYAGTSKLYPADQIRLEANPEGIRCMVLSDRGTVLLDPFCKMGPLHMMSYYKKNMPEGSKEDFER